MHWLDCDHSQPSATSTFPREEGRINCWGKESYTFGSTICVPLWLVMSVATDIPCTWTNTDSTPPTLLDRGWGLQLYSSVGGNLWSQPTPTPHRLWIGFPGFSVNFVPSRITVLFLNAQLAYDQYCGKLPIKNTLA